MLYNNNKYRIHVPNSVNHQYPYRNHACPTYVCPIHEY